MIPSAIGELLEANQVRRMTDSRCGAEVFFCLVQDCEVESRVKHQIEYDYGWMYHGQDVSDGDDE
jgi:hypothetical protein